MKSERAIRQRLMLVEAELTEQTAKCMKTGWGSTDGFKWDYRCVERRVLMEVLGLEYEAFNAADTMAAW